LADKSTFCPQKGFSKSWHLKKKPKERWLNKHIRNREERGRENGGREKQRVGDGRELL
jgi:hypothetical protein